MGPGGTVVPTRTVVWAAGMRASALTEQIPGSRDGIGRLQVDEHMRVIGVDGVYAAGDTAAAAENGHGAVHRWPFDPDGPGWYLIVEEPPEVHVLLVQWLG